MEFKPLTKPMNGIDLWFGRILLNTNWARSWSWGEDVGQSRRTTYFGVYRVQEARGTLVHLIIGPLKFTIGWKA